MQGRDLISALADFKGGSMSLKVKEAKGTELKGIGLKGTGFKGKKKWYVAIVVVIFLLVLIGLRLLRDKGIVLSDTPTLAIQTPQRVSVEDTKEITLDVTISSLGEAVYPAASMSISFDPSRLEFLGIEEGNVFVRCGENGVPQKLPEWRYNPEQCNQIGAINIMYLDLTGGKNAFSKELLAEKDNVVLRLKFRLRGSLRQGDVCDLIFEDAIFAASEEEESLAMNRNTLKVKNSKIVVGE